MRARRSVRSRPVARRGAAPHSSERAASFRVLLLAVRAVLVPAEAADQAQERAARNARVAFGRALLFAAAAADHGIALVTLGGRRRWASHGGHRLESS